MTWHNSSSSILFCTNGRNTIQSKQLLEPSIKAWTWYSSMEKYCSTASSCICSILGGIHCNYRQKRTSVFEGCQMKYATRNKFWSILQYESVQVVDILGTCMTGFAEEHRFECLLPFPAQRQLRIWHLFKWFAETTLELQGQSTISLLFVSSKIHGNWNTSWLKYTAETTAWYGWAVK